MKKIVMVLITAIMFSVMFPILAFADTLSTTEESNMNTAMDIKTNSVTLHASVDPGLEEYSYVTVCIVCTTDGEQYGYELLKENDYKKKVILPCGEYNIFDGGLINDYKNEFPIECKNFKVKEDKGTLVEFKIGNPDKQVKEEVTDNNDDNKITKNDILNDIHREKLNGIKTTGEKIKIIVLCVSAVIVIGVVGFVTAIVIRNKRN